MYFFINATTQLTMPHYNCKIPLDLSSPYYVKLDQKLRVIQYGPLLKKLIPKIETKDDFANYFDITSPGALEPAVDEDEIKIITATARDSRIHFNGNVFYDGSYWLLLTPSINEIAHLGITFNELPECSGLANQAHTLAISKSSLKSSRELAEHLNQKVKEKTKDLADKNRELISIQAKLLATEKASSLNKLLTGIAHEVNTPLGVVITSSSLLTKVADQIEESLRNKTLSVKLLKKCLAESRSANNLIANNANRLTELLNKLKQLDHQHRKHNYDKFSICELFDIVETHYLRECRIHQVILDVICQCNITLHSDQHILIDVLYILIDNCFDHAFNNTSTPRIELRASIIKHQLQISVSDNGCGIKGNMGDSILEPFITSERNKGHYGLGLCIAQLNAYHELKATLKVSETEQGSRFCLLFEGKVLSVE